MISTERMETFLESLTAGNSDFLEGIARQAVRDHVPIVRRDTQTLLKTILAMKKPKSILEIGCAVGFSALLFCENTPFSTHITTIEKDRKRIAEARKNFAAAKETERITLLAGDADDLLPALEEKYDFIFMDAAKAQYILWLPQVMKHLKKGGVLVSDNVLQDGSILESHFAVERRERTIYKRMREYLYALTHDEDLQTSILPVGDGAAVSVKIR